MTSPWCLSPLALACALLGCAVRGPAAGGGAARVEAGPERAPLGVRVADLEEGILVVGVHAGTGAAQAGLQPGDLLVEVDGVEVRRAPTAARHALRGPAGSVAALVVRAPLTGEYREVGVVRGLGEESLAARRELPDSVIKLRLALLDRGPGAARRRARAAVADDFGGMEPAQAVGFTLRRALERRPAAAVAAAEVLAAVHPEDDELRFKLGEVWHGVGRFSQAAVELSASEQGRPADTWQPGGDWRGDGGGNPRGRSMLALSLLELGDRDGATAIARELLRGRDDALLRQRLGMAPVRETAPWRAALPPLEELSLTTLEGQPWRLSDQRGHPVIITFFATWCGPCRAELPELHALWSQRREQGLQVLAISVDDADDADLLPAFVDELGLPFPVVHAPALKERFQVSGIPALRVIDGQGALVYSARGYSRAAMGRLSRVVDEVLGGAAEGAIGTGGQALLGEAWSAGQAELVGFLGIPGAFDLVVQDQAVAIGRDGGPPVVLTAEGIGAGTGVQGPAGGELLAWLDGPVVSQAGARWARAFTPSGRPRYLLTTPSPVAALAGSADQLWIATEEEVLAFDMLGRLLARFPGGATDLAPHEAGGVRAVDERVLRHLQVGASPSPALPAEGARRVDAAGRVASEVFVDMLTGRFGPDGAPRTVLVRTDGAVVGLDGNGAPAFTWELEEPPRIAALDGDGDGQDELLVAVRRQGLATVSLSLP